jgi:hypothetical protein
MTYDGLNPRLWRFYHIERGEIHAPLMIEDRINSERFAETNERYRTRQVEADRMLKNRDWEGYIFHHERPYRLRALNRCLARGLRDDELRRGKVVRLVWLDSENIRQHLARWRKVWGDEKPTQEELAVLATMPEPLRVFRGVGHRRGFSGISWTLSQERAQYFATRFSDNGFVASGVVVKDSIRAYLTERNEAEVVVFPEQVRDQTIVTATPLIRS